MINICSVVLSEAYIQKLIAIIIIVGSFFSPITLFLIVITGLVILDLITAIGKAIHLYQKEKIVKESLYNKVISYVKQISSRKLRRTVIKLFFYVMFVSAIYAFEIAIFSASIYLVNIAAGLLMITELVSIAENMSIVTGNNVFTNIISRCRKIFESKISDKIEK